MKGKIIAVVGAPASGKSFLVKKLAQYYKAIAFFEGEKKDLPKRITENLKKNIRNLETIVWFRNKLIKGMVKAEELAQKGKNVILDTFWLSNECYLKPVLKGFEKDIAAELLNLDREILDYPDMIIFLKVSRQTISDFIKKRGRKFDQGRSFIKRIIEINKQHEKLFTKARFKSLLIVERDEMDFEKNEDLEKIVKKIGNLEK